MEKWIGKINQKKTNSPNVALIETDTKILKSKGITAPNAIDWGFNRKRLLSDKTVPLVELGLDVSLRFLSI